MKNQIIIIGTLPPCPRCKLLTELVTLKSKQLGLNADTRHIAYTSEEAAQIADDSGLVPGTAKDVARLLETEIHLENMPKASELSELEQLKNLDPTFKPLESLFKEVYILDNWLRAFENQAKDVGILMTPVFIVNGEIKYHGSVPDLTYIEAVLMNLTIE